METCLLHAYRDLPSNKAVLSVQNVFRKFPSRSRRRNYFLTHGKNVSSSEELKITFYVFYPWRLRQA